MSFVSKGEKKMHNKAKAGKKGGERPLPKDGFGSKGEQEMHNEMPAKDGDNFRTPVGKDASAGDAKYEEKTTKSEYDPASGKRAKSVADLRAAAKKLNESSGSLGSPTGSEGGQDAKHMSSSKNSTGYMKAGMGAMDKKSKKAPLSQAPQDADDGEMGDPMEDDEEDSGQYKEGMTPSGKSRVKSLKDVKKRLKQMMQD